MIYDFELMIGGLCMLTFDRIPKPTKCQVLLVNATRPIPLFDRVPVSERPYLHYPRLTVSGKNLAHRTGERLPDRSMPSSDGEDFGIFEIDLEQLSLSVPGGAKLLTSFGRKAGGHRKPSAPGADSTWIDWTCGMFGSSFNDERIVGLLPECSDAPTKSGPVIASLEFSIGNLETFEVSRIAGQDQELSFDTWTSGGLNPPPPSHCLADRLCLRIRGISDQSRVEIESTAGRIVLNPPLGQVGRPLVRAALTNLHEVYHPPRRRIFDFAWFYSMVEWEGGPPDHETLIIPWVATGPYTPSSGLCPPAFRG